jgi:signal transduction histidine kinase
MKRTAINTSDVRWFGWVGTFWLTIVAGIFVLGAIQTAGDDPSVLHSWNGLLTLVLVVANLGWFGYMMWLRSTHRFWSASPPDPRRVYGLVILGVALTVSLVLLHQEFLGVTFAEIGVVVFVIDGWMSIVPVALLGLLFLYEAGVLSPTPGSRAAGDLISLVSTVAVVYTLVAVMKQRVQRDRLIAELQEAHRQLQEAHEQVQLAHVHEVELAALRERNRLAREMHDSLGHALVLIAIKIEAAQRLQAIDPDRAAAEWEQTKELVRSTMADLRNSIAGLRVPALEEQSFRQAMIELGSELQRNARVEVTTAVADAADTLDRSAQEALYRVAQEALANVARHAQARRATVRLELHGDAAVLEVGDDGVGLAGQGQAFADRPYAVNGHYGITGMRERVEALGGTFSVGPRGGGGTVVRANVPLEERIDARDPHPVS